MEKLTNFLKQAFQPRTHGSREPVWMLQACPEAALAMRDWPLLPEHGQESRAARERQIRRMADFHPF